MGYNAPTNDPVAALRRKQAEAAKAEREALSMGGTQPFQAVRKLQAQIKDLQELVSFLSGQQGVSERSKKWVDSGAGDTPLTWVAFDELYDASVNLVAPSSGEIRVGLSASVTTTAYAHYNDGSGAGLAQSSAATYVSYEVVGKAGPDGVEAVRLYTESLGENSTSKVGAHVAGTFHVTGLTGGQEYTVRTRRGKWGTSTNYPASVWGSGWEVGSVNLAIVKMGL